MLQKEPKQTGPWMERGRCRSLAQEPVATWLDSARASEDHALEIAKSNPTYCKLQFLGPPSDV